MKDDKRAGAGKPAQAGQGAAHSPTASWGRCAMR